MVIHDGISPEIAFQSATTSVVRRSRVQSDGESVPVMYPDRPVFSNILSSDSPRRIMSLTRLSVGSHVTPYQLVQQSVPVQVLKMPRYGSVKPDLNARRASRSDGGHELTTATAATTSTMARYVMVSFIFFWLVCFWRVCFGQYEYGVIYT